MKICLALKARNKSTIHVRPYYCRFCAKLENIFPYTGYRGAYEEVG